MANPFFSGRIPVELDKAVADHIQRTGETKTEVLIKALASYLEISVELPTKSIEISQHEFSNLVERIEVLEKAIKPRLPVISLDNNDNKNSNTSLELTEQDQNTIVTSNNDIEESQFLNNDSSDNKASPNKVIGPLSETEMANFLGVNKTILRNHRQNLRAKNKSLDTIKKIKRKADGLVYLVKYAEKAINKVGRPSIIWTATFENDDYN